MAADQEENEEVEQQEEEQQDEEAQDENQDEGQSEEQDKKPCSPITTAVRQVVFPKSVRSFMKRGQGASRIEKRSEQWPESIRGNLEFVNCEGVLCSGSACLIAPRLAFTAAHNLLDRRQSKEHTSLTFVLGAHKSKVTNAWYPKTYATNEDEDYAIVELETSFEDAGHGELVVFTQEDYISNEPADSVVIILEASGAAKVVGIHAGKGKNTYLTKERFQDLVKKVAEQAAWIQSHCESITARGSNHTSVSAQSVVQQFKTQKLYKIDLDQRNNQIRAAGMKIIATEVWPHLQEIALKFNCVKGKGLRYLIKADLINLQNIDISGSWFGNIGAKLLRRSDWPNLKSICINCNSVTPAGIKNIAKANWPKLQQLDNIGPIDHKGVKQLIRINWPKLKIVNLQRNGFGDDGAWQLAKTNWPLLQSLDLSRNDLNYVGAMHLGSRVSTSDATQSEITEQSTFVMADGRNWRAQTWMPLISGIKAQGTLQRLTGPN